MFEKIIKKAIEGGYDPRKRDWMRDCEIVCDPLFWQALGKSCGWKGSDVFDIPVSSTNGIWYVNDMHAFGLKYRTNVYKFYALKFHEINLTKGWDAAVSWLASLTGKEEIK